MAKLNPRTTVSKSVNERPDATVNKEGALAFTMDPKLELYTRVASWLVAEPKFYDPEMEGDKEIEALVRVVAAQDPEFVLKLAVYARKELYLRSAPVALLVQACRTAAKKFVRKYTPHIIQRADELTEAVAYYRKLNGDIGNQSKKGMLSNPLKRGLADAFHNFNAYQFAKYDRDGAVKLKDVIRIVHPKPRNEEESALFKQIRDRTVPVPETWETVISTKGSTKENWTEILPKMPYMAKLRNLRNFLDKDVDVAPAIQHLTNPKAIANSKQFPFRFFSAYREIEKNSSPQKQSALEALETAMELSVANVPKLPGTTFLTADNSGSMSAAVSEKSSVSRADVANVLQAISREICDDAITSVFAADFATVSLLKRTPILEAVQKFEHTQVGMATDAWKTINWLRTTGHSVDRIILFSDMQCYDSESRGYTGYLTNYSNGSLASELRAYRSSVNPDVYLYSVDLAGYGTAQFPQNEKKVCAIAGWSDRILNFIPIYEATGKQALETVENYVIAPTSAADVDAQA